MYITFVSLMALRHAILALLEEHPLTGYEIKESFDGPLGLMWSASYGGLYPALHRMKLEEYISEEFVLQKDKPNRKVYTITPKGAQELKRWFHTPPLPESVKDEFLLKMYLLPEADPLSVETLLSERKQRDLTKAAYFESEARKKTKRSLFIDYNLHRLSEELKWISGALRTIKQKHISNS